MPRRRPRRGRPAPDLSLSMQFACRRGCNSLASASSPAFPDWPGLPATGPIFTQPARKRRDYPKPFGRPSGGAATLAPVGLAGRARRLLMYSAVSGRPGRAGGGRPSSPRTGPFMFKRRSQILTAAFLVCDLLMTALAWCGSYYLRFYGGVIPVTKATPDAALCWINLPLVLLLAVGWPPDHRPVRHPPPAPPPRRSRRRPQRRDAAHAADGGLDLFPPRPLRIAARHGAVLGVVLFPGADGPPLRLGRRPHPAQPRLQPDLRPHRRHRPGRPQDGPRLCTRQLDGHQEPRLRRGPARPAVQRPRRARQLRRPAGADREISRSTTSSSPCR